MERTGFLLAALLLALLGCVYLAARLRRVRRQLSDIQAALDDIKAGNLNRRVLTRADDLTRHICYDINEIALADQARFIRQRQADRSYRRLMTSLSHDVKTPLASLVGYLEAIQQGLVTGAEREEYLRVAADKAHRLKDFVNALFEWVKLDAGEQVFHFEPVDLNELTRSILADWVPALEASHVDYEFEIPETAWISQVDSNAFTRILNNLLQNVLVHSAATGIRLTLAEDRQRAVLTLTDNGRGIPAEDLPYLFERLYQCDRARSAVGNGLGLSIAKQLTKAHRGTIHAASIPGRETTFTVELPRTL
ncbi:MAG: HAMP domain-containing sensor histidine kinase [Eubacteriales bacterium]|nr:HAMP domain-containing sensor histidine kinase [Eubacteriales bacterium]